MRSLIDFLAKVYGAALLAVAIWEFSKYILFNV